MTLSTWSLRVHMHIYTTYTYNESFGGQLISFGNSVIYVTNEERKILRTDMPHNGGGGSDDNGTGGNNN